MTPAQLSAYRAALLADAMEYWQRSVVYFDAVNTRQGARMCGDATMSLFLARLTKYNQKIELSLEAFKEVAITIPPEIIILPITGTSSKSWALETFKSHCDLADPREDIQSELQEIRIATIQRLLGKPLFGQLPSRRRVA